MQFRHARVIAGRHAVNFNYVAGLERAINLAKNRNGLAEGVLRAAVFYDLKASMKKEFQPNHYAAYPKKPLLDAVRQNQEILRHAVENANQISFGLPMFYKTWNTLEYAFTAFISGVSAFSALKSATLYYFLSTVSDQALSQNASTAAALALVSTGFSLFFANVFAHMRALRKATRMCLDGISFEPSYAEQTAEFMLQTIALQRDVLEKRVRYEGNCLEAYSGILDLLKKMDAQDFFSPRFYMLRTRESQNAFLDAADAQTGTDLESIKSHILSEGLSLPYALHSLELLAHIDRSVGIAVKYGNFE